MGRCATVFGLDVSAELDLPFLAGGSPRRTGRPLRIELADGRAIDADWPASSVVVCDQRAHDGTVNFRIEHDADAGFLISGPRYGRHLLSADGRRATCWPDGLADSAWQRLLIAQVLPFAATLQGLETFHASAVATDEGAVAIAGPSGAGKTSLAIELCRSGAGFLADDVVALERDGEALVAHPGTPAAGLASDYAREQQAKRLPAADPIGQPIGGNAREQLVCVRGASGPRRLAAMFFLERRHGGPRQPRFVALDDARELLAATFNGVLADGERLRRLLDVCALAARGRVERVVVDANVSPATLAGALAGRLGVAS
jgi:hypothetical protein